MKNTEYNLKLTAEQTAAVMAGLAELPIKVGSSAWDACRTQIVEQDKAADAAVKPV